MCVDGGVRTGVLAFAVRGATAARLGSLPVEGSGSEIRARQRQPESRNACFLLHPELLRFWLERSRPNKSAPGLSLSRNRRIRWSRFTTSAQAFRRYDSAARGLAHLPPVRYQSVWGGWSDDRACRYPRA